MSDLIDRQAAIDTLDKHLRTTDVPVSYPGIISALTEWLNELPSAQANSKETSSTHKALDTISRQAALNALSRGSGCGASCHRAIKTLPSAQPEIIRCKDCVYWVAHDKRCVYLNHGFYPNMWCCHGRRADG